MRKQVIGLLAIYCALFAAACTDKASDNIAPQWLSSEKPVYNAMCQTDTLRFRAAGNWQVTTDCDWMTLMQEEGQGDGAVSVYIQQNDDEQTRQGELVVRLEDGQTLNLHVTQYSSDDNALGALVNLPQSYGLGWGYDFSVDYADPDGLRGQVFDAAKVTRFGGEDAITVYTKTSTDIETYYEHTVQELMHSMSAKVGGGLDLRIASAKVEVEYAKQISETKDRLYVWYRDKRIVREARFESFIVNPNRFAQCLTASFKKAAHSLSPAEFVRKYGTHLITRSYLGGRFDYYFTVSQDITEEVDKLALTISVKLLFWNASATTADEKTWTDIKRDFIADFEVSGGGEAGRVLNEELKRTASQGIPMTSGEQLINNWVARFSDAATVQDEDLTMVGFEVTPIWEILKAVDASKAEELKNYIVNEYLK